MMKICINCFDDPDLKLRIKSLDHHDICDVHGKRELIFNTDANESLSIKNDFSQLLDLYVIADDHSLLPKTLIDRLDKDWGIFSKLLAEDQTLAIIKELVKENYDSNDPIFWHPLVLGQLQDKSFRKKNFILENNDWGAFKEALLHKNRFFNDIDTDLLIQVLGWSKVILDTKKQYYRARIVNSFDEVSKVKDMLIPPIDILDRSEGRLNPRGIGMLYVTTSSETALKEIRASFNDKVVLASGYLNKNVNVIDLSEVTRLSPFRMLNSKMLYVYQLNKDIVRAMVNDLEKPVRTNRVGLEYIPTQFISSLIQKYYDGIKYRSTMVNNEKEYNLALFNDKFISFDVDNFKQEIVVGVDYRIR